MLGDADMAKWWMGLALAAVVASQPNAALAQHAPGGMPEPAPVAPCGIGGGPNLVPGPLTSSMAPPGPGPDLSLSADHSSAFSCKQEPSHCEVYVSFGALALQAYRLGHGQVSFLDPGDGTDTGNVPTLNRDLNNTTLDYSALVPPFEWGVTGTIGISFDHWAIEASGFYIPQQSSSKTVSNPGKLDLNFINAPLGFEGDNGLWLQADQVRLREQIRLGSGEVNIRCCSPIMSGIEPFIGVRYLDVRERLGIFTDDDGLTFVDVNGNPDPTLQATYTVTSHSRIVAPQAGFEVDLPVCSRLAFNAVAKGAWGVNFYEQNVSLVRGDGLVGFDTHSSHRQFSHLYELGFNLDYYLLERMRIRAGYNLLWVVDIPIAKEQVDFDLSNTAGGRNDHGSLFFHGPRIELQFLF